MEKFMYLFWNVAYPFLLGGLSLYAFNCLKYAIQSGSGYVWPISELVFCISAFISLSILHSQEFDDK